MLPRFAALALSASLVLVGVALPTPTAAADVRSMAATGDSITRAFNLCFFPFTDCPAQSWSTGSNTTVRSHARRLGVLNSAYNDAVSGAKMADLPGQVNTVFGRNVDYVTVLMGGNDVCTDTEGAMTTPSSYATAFKQAMDKLKTDGSPPLVYVVSVPNVYTLWQILKDDSSARSAWSRYNVCQSLLANPLSMERADLDRRERVKQRNMELNQALRTACAAYPFCRFDGERVFGTPFVPNDVSTRDYFHPSTAGQAKLAEVSWTYGPLVTSTVNDAPVADFDWQCSGLSCTFLDVSTDPTHTISGRSWNFDSGRPGGPTSTLPDPAHTFPAAGTYTVTLHAIDAFGATDSFSVDITVGGGSEPTNSLPSATFTSECTDLACDFTDTSTDTDGTISSRSWNFGDGGTSTAESPSHTYAAGGTYTVTLTVTDNAGGTDSASQSVTVATSSTTISLGVTAYKLKGVQHADLSWTPSDSATSVRVIRNANEIGITPNDGFHTDNIGQKGGGTYTYQVCVVGTSTCSNEVTVSY